MLEKPAEKVAWESAAFGKTIVFLRIPLSYKMAILEAIILFTKILGTIIIHSVHMI